jgi:hypothetical protein
VSEPVATDLQGQLAGNAIAILNLSPDRITPRRFDTELRSQRRRPVLACLVHGLTPHQRDLRKIGLLATNRKPRALAIGGHADNQETFIDKNRLWEPQLDSRDVRNDAAAARYRSIADNATFIHER